MLDILRGGTMLDIYGEGGGYRVEYIQGCVYRVRHIQGGVPC